MCQPPPCSISYVLEQVAMSAHTTVSVTNGIGNALFGGLEGVALCVGGNGGRLDMHRVAERKAL